MSPSEEENGRGLPELVSFEAAASPERRQHGFEARPCTPRKRDMRSAKRKTPRLLYLIVPVFR